MKRAEEMWKRAEKMQNQGETKVETGGKNQESCLI